MLNGFFFQNNDGSYTKNCLLFGPDLIVETGHALLHIMNSESPYGGREEDSAPVILVLGIDSTAIAHT